MWVCGLGLRSRWPFQLAKLVNIAFLWFAGIDLAAFGSCSRLLLSLALYANGRGWHFMKRDMLAIYHILIYTIFVCVQNAVQLGICRAHIYVVVCLMGRGLGLSVLARNVWLHSTDLSIVLSWMATTLTEAEGPGGLVGTIASHTYWSHNRSWVLCVS